MEVPAQMRRTEVVSLYSSTLRSHYLVIGSNQRQTVI
uniref:Uncharacterized protein n=1 Tax=Heterorhabditis bacteriophora TaxID=37862 RepID=A0A1I7WEH2_HETBA